MSTAGADETRTEAGPPAGVEAGARAVRLVFISGIEGSGTTMLTRILASLPGAVGLGGNHVSVPRDDRAAFPLARSFNDANAACWDRHATVEAADAARRRMGEVLAELLALPGYDEITHVVYKRSAPFMREPDRHRPDLLDLAAIADDVRVIVACRDPRAATASALRRGFFDEVRRAAVTHEEQLTYLDAQLAAMPPERRFLLPYERFCRDPGPAAAALADFIDVDPAAVVAAVAAEAPDPNRTGLWRERLDGDALAFLDRFFCARRRAQWPLIAAAC